METQKSTKETAAQTQQETTKSHKNITNSLGRESNPLFLLCFLVAKRLLQFRRQLRVAPRFGFEFFQSSRRSRVGLPDERGQLL